jgi:dTDP-4-amino-4,6-dideoxygalactose transaminase
MISIASPNLGEEEERAVLDVLRSGRLAQGPKVAEFEKNFAEFIGVKHAIATTSGTTALELAIAVFDFPKDSEIITTSFTFVATANTIVLNGCKPVFVDIDEKTFNLDPNLIEAKITKKTVAIMPIHLYGQCCDMDKINEIAKKHNLKVIEDACQSHGAEYNNKKSGSLGDLACFSFYATKNMMTGEGGMITTNSDELAEKIRLLRNHGQIERYKIKLIGVNARMTELQAAIGVEQLKKLPKMNEKRQEIAKQYDERLKNNFEIPYVASENKHVYHQYTIKTQNRDDLIEKLKQNEIGYGIYYPIPIHLQEPYIKKFNYGEGDCPVSEKLAKQVLSLPIHPKISLEDVEKVCGVLVDEK